MRTFPLAFFISYHGRTVIHLDEELCIVTKTFCTIPLPSETLASCSGTICWNLKPTTVNSLWRFVCVHSTQICRGQKDTSLYPGQDSPAVHLKLICIYNVTDEGKQTTLLNFSPLTFVNSCVFFLKSGYFYSGSAGHITPCLAYCDETRMNKAVIRSRAEISSVVSPLPHQPCVGSHPPRMKVFPKMR